MSTINITRQNALSAHVGYYARVAAALDAVSWSILVLPMRIATAMELGCSTLILIGLAARFAALGLVGMIAVIQIFVYPNAWPDHIQWLAFLIPIIVRGAGRFSVDAGIGRALGLK
ncbi:MAG TPA: DoxX family protein [Alphaproteobacteria bacterium]|nr:DoxX family protein [Alphaproteobacteria bacterium]